MSDDGRRVGRGFLLAGGAVVLLAGLAAVYFPVVRNGWVWDDWTTRVSLRSRWGGGLEGVRWALTSFAAGHYQPLTWLSYALEDRLFGPSPLAAHVVNVALHAANALLVLLVSRRLLERAAGRRGAEAPERTIHLAAFLSAALFAWHPLRVESVAWATERRDLLSALFCLVALLAHLEAVAAQTDGSPARRARWLVATSAAFALALLCKAQVTFPLGLLVLDVHPLGRLAAPRGRGAVRLVAEKSVLLLLSLGAGLAALAAQAREGALVSGREEGIAARAAQAAYGLFHYVRATIWPSPLSPLWERPVPLDPLEPRFVLGGAFVLVAAALLWLLRRRAPAAVAAAGWYAVLLLPVLGVAQSGVQLVAERYSYLATAGATLLLAWQIVDGASRSRGRALRVAVAGGTLAVLVAAGLAARRHVGVFRDDETLWRHVLSVGPSALASSNLGSVLVSRGEVRPGVELLLESLRTVPSYARPWYGVRQVLERAPLSVGPDLAQRIAAALQASIAFHRSSAPARYTLALARWRAGDRSGARSALGEALALQPGYRPAVSALAAMDAEPLPPPRSDASAGAR